MEQLDGYTDSRMRNWVWHPNKGLYGQPWLSMWDLGSPFYVLSAVGLYAAISNNSGCMGGQLVLTTANLGIPNLNGGAIGSGYDVLRMYLESRKCTAQ